MGKRMKKMVAVLFCLALIAGCFMPSQTVKADGGDLLLSYAKNITLSRKGNTDEDYYYMDLPVKGEIKKITAKSSNSKVIKVEKGSFFFHAKKTGKAKVTYKVKLTNGKTKKYVSNIKVVKYKNPFKSLKLDSKNYAKKFNKKTGKTEGISYSTKKKSVKISIKAASGCKIKSIKRCQYSSTGKETWSKVKNNTSVKLIKGAAIIQIKMYNKNTKATDKFDIYVYNGELM